MEEITQCKPLVTVNISRKLDETS